MLLSWAIHNISIFFSIMSSSIQFYINCRQDSTWIRNGRRRLYLNRWDVYGGLQNQGWSAKYKQQRTKKKGLGSSLKTFKIEQSGKSLSGQRLVQHLRYRLKLTTVISSMVKDFAVKLMLK